MGILINRLKQQVLDRAKEVKIVFAEGRSENIQKAAEQLVKESKVMPILLFDKIDEFPTKRNPKVKYISLDKVDIEQYAQYLYDLRKSKGLSIEEARKLVLHRNYFASIMVKQEKADGEVCGIEYTTADTLRPALQVVKTDPNYSLVTSAFVIEKGNESYVFGDCSINIDPDAKQLADIARALADFSRKTLGLEKVKVALLSFSTVGSGKSSSVEKVQTAAQELIKENSKDIEYFGEMQFDAAFVNEVRKRKAPNLKWDSRPNVFVFPNLDSGNIGYKIAQRMGGYEAIGPVLIGLAAPINDLSRGASASDVVELAYITAAQVISRGK